MRAIILGLLVFGGGCAAGGGAAGPASMPGPARGVGQRIDPERRYPPEALLADVAAVVRTIENVHPDPYYFTPREQIAARRAELERALARPMRRVDLYPLLARFVAAYGDAHTHARFPLAEWQEHVAAQAPLFPLDVALRGDELIVTHAHLPGVGPQPGDRLASVNGVAVETLVGAFLESTPGSAAFKRSSYGGSNRFQIWLQGIRPPYDVVYRDMAAGRTARAVLPGLAAGDMVPRRSPTSAGPEASYSFARLGTDGAIGLIDFRRMNDPLSFERFLERTFDDLKLRPAAGLIIDLRRNGGGNSELGRMLIEYITDRPFRMADRKEWKVSREYRAHLVSTAPLLLRWLPPALTTGVGPRYWATPVGELAVYRSEPDERRFNRRRFDGPVAVLIGPYTFSSAAMTANAIGDFKLATLIGEETGGVPNHFGEVYTFHLPHTGLEVGVSSARFVRANGDAADPRGVRPDIEIRQSEADLRVGVDTVLEFAQAWVRRQGRASEP